MDDFCGVFLFETSLNMNQPMKVSCETPKLPLGGIDAVFEIGRCRKVYCDGNDDIEYVEVRGKSELVEKGCSWGCN
jgi:hypothetical protein